jgi:GH43 family beta-xylosidase
MKRLLISLVTVVLLAAILVLAMPLAVSATTMQNPIVAPSGGAGSADPSVFFKDGYYYYCKSLNDAAIGVAKAQRIQDIGGAPMVTVYTPPSGAYSKELWAPELQYVNGSWYIYFAADDGNNVNHRMYCLQANSSDPQGSYTFRGKVSSSDNKWAIDGTILQKTDGSLYFVWSGCEVNADFPQNLYIAPMSNPYTISGSKVKISTPTYAWEKNGAAINEGPTVLIKNGSIHIVYSASASWLNEYCLGRITNTDGNVLNPGSWVKNSTAVFSQAATAYGVGHNCFTKSPNGTEDWIVYHAFQISSGGWGNRSVRAQKITWSGNNPVLGTPLAYGAVVADPSGTPQYSYFRLESINIANNCIRHQSGRGRIDPGINQSQDSQFYIVGGLADSAGVSFQSVNYPNCYLRHRNGEIWLDTNDGSQLFKDDATFYKRPGLANSSAVSFQSKNFPGNYIRHRNSLLYSEAVSDTLGKNDATFWQR